MELVLFLTVCLFYRSLLLVPHFQVEEIDDVDGTLSDPFIADALANEGDLNLTEEQKKNFRKVSFVFKVHLN